MLISEGLESLRHLGDVRGRRRKAGAFYAGGGVVKRALRLGLLAAAAGAAFLAPGAARADCAGDLAQLKAKLPQVQDAKQREELWLILEKASVDEAHGRMRLCSEALEHARKLAR